MWLKWAKKMTICAMQIATQIKSTHRPSAPGSAHLPACATGDREETTQAGLLVCVAVGAKQHGAASLWLSTLCRDVLRGHWRGLGGCFSQLGPVLEPVKRPHLNATNCAASKALDGFAMLSRNGLATIHHVGHESLGHTEVFRQCTSPTPFKLAPRFEFHSKIISHWLSVCQ